MLISLSGSDQVTPSVHLLRFAAGLLNANLHAAAVAPRCIALRFAAGLLNANLADARAATRTF